jgi:hypothetical protein
MGRQRIYHNPKKVHISRKKSEQLPPSERIMRNYSDSDVDSEKIMQTFNETFDFMPLAESGGKVVGKNVELIIDGEEYNAKTNPDAELAKNLPASFSSDQSFLNNWEAQQNSQQQNKFNTMNGSMNGSMNTIPSNVKGTVNNWNKDASIDNINNSAKPKSTKYCARHVLNSLEAGGLSVQRVNANDMPKSLINAGFSQLPLNTTPTLCGPIGFNTTISPFIGVVFNGN